MADETGARPSRRDVAFALLFAIGSNTLMAPRGPVAVAPAAACPGALEAVASVVARLAPSAPLGIWLFNVDRVLAIAAVAAFAILATRSAGGWLAAAATALAFASQLPFAPRFSVFGPAVILVPALTLLALTQRRTGSNTDLCVWLGLWLTAAISPVLTLPLAVVAALYAGGARWVTLERRSRAAAVAAAALVAWVTLFQAVMPGGAPAFTHPLSCLLPSAGVDTRIDWGGELRSMLSVAGVYACSLAALGAFSFRGALRQRRTWMVAAYVATSVAVSWIGRDAARLLGPATVAFWALVAVGLAEAVRACGGAPGGRVAAGLLILLLPLVQMSARAGEMTGVARAGLEGHERLTLQAVAQTLRILPDDSAIVEEDATLEVLLRALDGTWQRAGKRLHLLPRRVADVAAALNSGTHVFAAPAAQAELATTGFRLTPLQDASGFAEVREGGACTLLDDQWHVLPGALRSSRLALVAETDAEVGPMVVYLASAQVPEVRAIDWPPLTNRGFHPRSYDREAIGDPARIDASLREDGVPPASPVLTARYLTRLELWRTPGAPHILTVELGVTPNAAIARLGVDAAVRRLMVCPVFQLTRGSIPGTIVS